MNERVAKQNKDGTWTIRTQMPPPTCWCCKAPLDKDLVCTKCGCAHTIVINLIPLGGGGGSGTDAEDNV